MKSGLLISLFLLLSLPVFGQKKVALIIGNGSYRQGKGLFTPDNNANDVAQAVRSLGFTVQTIINGRREDMIREIDIFGRRTLTADEAIFFYSGHAVSYNDKNYLVPVDADFSIPAAIPESCVEISRLFKRSGARASAFFLDACRNQPFSGGSGLYNLGLETELPDQSLILYASDPDVPVQDGAERNSVFTRHVLANIRTPGKDILNVAELICQGIINETRMSQYPTVLSNMAGGRMILVPGSLYSPDFSG
jgi:uncharacterized caspase-like protein